MNKHPQITRDRIKQFIDFELREKLVREKLPLPTKFLQANCKSEKEARSTKGWRPIEPGERWGPAYTFAWYQLDVKVPARIQDESLAIMYGKAEVEWSNWEMIEGTFWKDNCPAGGLDGGHLYYRLEPGVQKANLLVQTYAHNSETTVHRPEKARRPDPEHFRGFWLAVLDEDRFPLFYDCEFAYDLMKEVDEGDPLHHHLMRALNQVCNTFDETKLGTYRACRKILKDVILQANCGLDHTITPVGHAHLDTAWLWPLSVTRLKMAHTTSVQLDLMEGYPEHVFCHSQASQYEWLEQEHPELFRRVKEMASKGQWEPLGSMWVEADCNLTGAESLVRQFLYGRRYFKKHFRQSTTDMFLPDVFGYSAALPQILNLFNIRYFLTQKMSWNSINKIPHNTFWWKGIDGTSVWTHFPPADTYCASCAPSEIIQSVKKYRDKGRSDHSLLLHGFGDGGGGPTEWHLERLRRARRSPHMPSVERKSKVRDFYEKAYQTSRDLMTWHGELYLEFHRGTYTSQAANKRFNRECEFLLRDAELLCSFHGKFPRDYPAVVLESHWKTVLLNQFHDIIPGSSVKEVYEDSTKDYHEVISGLRKQILSEMKGKASLMETSHLEHPHACFHFADQVTQAQILWSGKDAPQSLVARSGTAPAQVVEWCGEKSVIFACPPTAQKTVDVVGFSEKPHQGEEFLKATNRRLENAEFSVRFDSNGNITSIQSMDEFPLEFIQPGKLANLFQILDDKPLFWDAWDTELYAQETVQDLTKSDSFEVVERGPVRVAVELVKTFGKSTIRQRISLGPTPGVRFDTWVDWQEDHKFLKVAFPINVNSDKATYEIQFGHVERPTHRNTSWDAARFEVCAQKWADLSEGSQGVALINTGKYGHDCEGSTMRLSLLRSPKAPDPTCDRGIHRITYVLLPHYQKEIGDIVSAAYAVNAEVHTAPVAPSKGIKQSPPPFLAIDSADLVIESVKKAEDHPYRIVRLYECNNSRGRARLNLAMDIEKGWYCDLDENRLEPLQIVDGTAIVDYRPFQIITLMLQS